MNMQTIDDALQKPSTIPGNGMGLDDDNPEYKLIAECNFLLTEIDNEIAVVHRFICDKYRLKFRELESLVQHPIDYARVVKVIGNEMDLTLVNLDGILPSTIIHGRIYYRIDNWRQASPRGHPSKDHRRL